MSKEQKKLQKRKAREKEVKGKLMAKRDEKRKSERLEREDQIKGAQLRKVFRERVALEQWANEVQGKISENVREQILHNIEILKSLEEEYSSELEEKLRVQNGLKAEGHESLEAMVGALQEKAAQDSVQRELEESVEGEEDVLDYVTASQVSEIKFGGSADCRMTVNEPSE